MDETGDHQELVKKVYKAIERAISETLVTDEDKSKIDDVCVTPYSVADETIKDIQEVASQCDNAAMAECFSALRNNMPSYEGNDSSIKNPILN
jgi:hypothetical protein